MVTTAANLMNQHPNGSGARLVALDGRPLPLRAVRLRAEARGGIARVTLTQEFVNVYDEPLAVTYLLPLPADGAVSAFAFTIAERRIVGEIDRRAAARQRFEEAVASGRTAALVEQERSSLFTQEIGNIPPRATVHAELAIDQKLNWLDEGAWEWRFPTVVMPRYQGAAGRVADAEKVTVDVANGPLQTRAELALTIGDTLAAGRAPESPSHAVQREADGVVRLIAPSGAALDRDIVVRWSVAAPEPGLTLDVARPAAGKPHAQHAYGLLTLVPPPRATCRGQAVARDLCLLIDTSGSMSGEPLDQARRLLLALVDSLGDQDTLEMIEFSTQARRWKRTAVKATAATRAEAQKWLRGLTANGGTEMRDGLIEALAPLRADTQRQIVLVTDGGISFEQEIVAEILKSLPRPSRVHTVGVGSGVNRSLTQPAARAGRGVEVIIGIGEDPERATQRILARTATPLVVELELEGPALRGQAPVKLPDLYAGAPALLSLQLDPAGGELWARGRSHDGAWSQRIVVPPAAEGAGSGAVVALFGREAVEDLEMRLCAGEGAATIDAAVERLGLEFQIATRLTSWVAVDEQRSVDPTQPSRKERMPHELPFGMSADGIGLGRAPHLAAPAGRPMMSMMAGVARSPAAFGGPAAGGMAPPPAPMAKKRSGILGALGRMFDKDEGGPAAPSAAAPPPPAEPLEESRSEIQGEAADDEARVSMPKLAQPAPKARRRGRIVQRSGRTWIVELEVDEALDWETLDDVTVEDERGVRTAARVDRSRTTRDGRIGAGQRVRLVIALTGDVDAPRSIDCGNLVIEV